MKVSFIKTNKRKYSVDENFDDLLEEKIDVSTLTFKTSIRGPDFLDFSWCNKRYVLDIENSKKLFIHNEWPSWLAENIFGKNIDYSKKERIKELKRIIEEKGYIKYGQEIQNVTGWKKIRDNNLLSYIYLYIITYYYMKRDENKEKQIKKINQSSVVEWYFFELTEEEKCFNRKINPEYVTIEFIERIHVIEITIKGRKYDLDIFKARNFFSINKLPYFLMYMIKGDNIKYTEKKVGKIKKILIHYGYLKEGQKIRDVTTIEEMGNKTLKSHMFLYIIHYKYIKNIEIDMNCDEIVVEWYFEKNK